MDDKKVKRWIENELEQSAQRYHLRSFNPSRALLFFLPINIYEEYRKKILSDCVHVIDQGAFSVHAELKLIYESPLNQFSMSYISKLADLTFKHLEIVIFLSLILPLEMHSKLLQWLSSNFMIYSADIKKIFESGLIQCSYMSNETYYRANEEIANIFTQLIIDKQKWYTALSIIIINHDLSFFDIDSQTYFVYHSIMELSLKLLEKLLYAENYNEKIIILGLSAKIGECNTFATNFKLAKSWLKFAASYNKSCTDAIYLYMRYHISINCGNIYLICGNYKKAEIYFSSARNYQMITAKNLSEIFMLESNIAVLEHMQGFSSHALKRYYSLILSSSFDSSLSSCYCYFTVMINLGFISCDKLFYEISYNAYEDARNCYLQIKEIKKERVYFFDILLYLGTLTLYNEVNKSDRILELIKQYKYCSDLWK